jgi:hypothetical protein
MNHVGKILSAVASALLLAGAMSCAEVDPGTSQTNSAATAAAKAPCAVIENEGGVCRDARPRKLKCPRVDADQPANCVPTGELTPGAFKTVCCP